MTKTKKVRFKKNLQKTKSCKKKLHNYEPSVRRTREGGSSDDYNVDDGLLSNLSKNFWSLLGY